MSDAFAAVLDRLSRVPGVEGALLVDADAGVLVAADLAGGVDGGAVAALTASLYRQTARAAGDAGLGALETVHLEAEAGHVLVAGAAAPTLLVVAVAAVDAQLGLVRVETQRIAAELL
ncbi:MAG: roadblock/LC7 domain-containing protein [Gemmatimonadetes bacterium]|nr:roadblock/LC7 domain-containing protein [Gemmatimonadota bacterium]